MAVEIIGRSTFAYEIREFICRAAKEDEFGLLLGETGVGREVVARNIHELIGRKGLPFVAINCASLAENLAEAELFKKKELSPTPEKTE